MAFIALRSTPIRTYSGSALPMVRVWEAPPSECLAFPLFQCVVMQKNLSLSRTSIRRSYRRGQNLMHPLTFFSPQSACRPWKWKVHATRIALRKFSRTLGKQGKTQDGPWNSIWWFKFFDKPRIKAEKRMRTAMLPTDRAIAQRVNIWPVPEALWVVQFNLNKNCTLCGRFSSWFWSLYPDCAAAN